MELQNENETQKIKIKCFKIPVTRHGDKITYEEDSKEELTQEEKEIELGLDEKLSLSQEITNLNKEIARYNDRQVKLLELDLTREFVNRKLLFSEELN